MELWVETVTRAELLVLSSISSINVAALGRNTKSILSDFPRTVPFTTVNVVARIAFMCTLNVYALCFGKAAMSYNIVTCLRRFANGELAWREFVRTSKELERKLDLSEEFCSSVMKFLRQHAFSLIAYLDRVPGDLTLPGALSAGENEEVQSNASFVPQ